MGKKRKSQIKRISFINRFIKSAFLEVLLITIGIGTIFGFNVWIKKKPFNIAQFVEIKFLVSISISYIMAVSIRFFARKLERYLEEGTKMAQTFDDVSKFYESESLYTVKELPGYIDKEVCFPIIRLHKDLSSCKFAVYDEPSKYYELPHLIQSMYPTLFEAHSQSDLHNGTLIRLDDVKENDKSKTLELFTSRTTYYDSMVTNWVMDFEVKKHLTIRQLYHHNKRLEPLKESKFSNHIGLNGMILTKDNKWVFVKRRGAFTRGKFSLGGSIGSGFTEPTTGDVTFNDFEKAVRKMVEKRYGSCFAKTVVSNDAKIPINNG